MKVEQKDENRFQEADSAFILNTIYLIAITVCVLYFYKSDNMMFIVVFLTVLLTDNFAQCKILLHKAVQNGQIENSWDSVPGFGDATIDSPAYRTLTMGTTPKLIKLDSDLGIGNIHLREKRALSNSNSSGSAQGKSPNITVSVLKDKDHNEAIIHWSGKKSPVS